MRSSEEASGFVRAGLAAGEAPEAVALGGLPSELDAGTAEQLSATGSDNAGSGDLRSGDLRSGDLRWSVEPIGGGDAVPEPATWLTMLLGFFGLGGLARRRKALARA